MYAFFSIWQICYLLLQFFNNTEHIVIVVNGQRLKINLAIWLHL